MAEMESSTRAVLRAAQAAAVASIGAYPPRAGALVGYEVEGSLLIVGDAGEALAAGERLMARHRVVAVVTGRVPPSRPRGVALAPGRVVRLQGWLGHFKAYAAGPGRDLLDLGPLSPRADGFFDRVLDLGETPLLRDEVLPLGYHAPGTEPHAIASAVEHLAAAPGRLDKPRYFRFDASICVHSAKGLIGCNRCLDACPAGAIDCVGDKVAVEPYLCQGCGTCALVCPTGALSYAYPPRERILADLAGALAAYRSTGGGAPRLLVYDGPTSLDAETLPADVVPLRAHAVVSIGMEVWLTALAWGWGGVYLLPHASTPTGSRRLLLSQVDLARSFLDAAGERPGRLGVLSGESELEPAPAPAETLRLEMGEPPAGKRAVLLGAMNALSAAVSGADGVIPVPPGAPFGSLRVDRERCTLCLGCVGLCPTGALQGAAGQLRFVESSCVQCGLCAAGCPERAVELVPGLHLGADARDRPRVLNEAELFRCVSCGAPFAPAALVRAATARVRHLPMFAGEGLRLLDMCPACRMRETMGGARPGAA